MKEKDQSHAWPTLGSLKQRWAKLDELLSLCQISLHFPRNNRRSFRNFPRAFFIPRGDFVSLEIWMLRERSD